MKLTENERDRLLIYLTAELARARRARGLLLNVVEATALVADAVCEAARDGKRLGEAVDIARSVINEREVLPGVIRAVPEVRVEAVFDGPPPDVTAVPGVSHVEVDGQRLRCQVLGSIQPLLKVVANAGVRELLSAEPSLEELFLSHYGA